MGNGVTYCWGGGDTCWQLGDRELEVSPVPAYMGSCPEGPVIHSLTLGASGIGVGSYTIMAAAPTLRMCSLPGPVPTFMSFILNSK